MRRFLFCFLLVFVTGSVAFADDGNVNEWFPSGDIPGVYLVELFSFHGLPRNTVPGREIKVLVNHGYAVGYSEELKVPLYAVYRFGNLQEPAEELQERSFERPPSFQVDLRTDARVTADDYTSSGYDRGHMAPNYGLRSQYGHLAQIETFLMSNIAPQKPGLNRYTWRYAEEKIAKKLAQDDRDPEKKGDDIKDLWVISGPIFEGQTKYIGDKKKIGVPTGFYKIIVRQPHFKTSSAQAIAIYYPHKPGPEEKKEQLVTIDFIEQKTGLDFHPNLIDKTENKLEKKTRGWNWKEINQ